MNFLGMGTFEVAIVLLVAFLFLGPERMLNAARMFGNEARISTAQLAATFGINRLVEDVRRAGFMSSPNIAADPRVCGQKSKFPDGMKALASVTIEEGGSVLRHIRRKQGAER